MVVEGYWEQAHGALSKAAGTTRNPGRPWHVRIESRIVQLHVWSEGPNEHDGLRVIRSPSLSFPTTTATRT